MLAALPREEDNPWVIRGRVPGTHLTDLQRPWRRIRARTGLEDVRIHDLRHSYASRALALGESLTMIGKLLGHTQVRTTARYAHLARDSIQNAAARITGSIGESLAPDGRRAPSRCEGLTPSSTVPGYLGHDLGISVKARQQLVHLTSETHLCGMATPWNGLLRPDHRNQAIRPILVLLE